MNANPRSLVSIFLHHPNAANLLMVLMILFGVAALGRINTQFFPTIQTDSVSVSISWPGASAEDVERNILSVAEPELRFIEGVKEMNSYAREGSASIRLSFDEGHDIDKGVSDVETAVRAIGNLPEESEDPKVSTAQFFDGVATISIGGDVPEAVLRDWAKRIRDELIARGIDKVSFEGLRNPELQVTIPERDLRRLDLSVTDVTRAITANARDVPSGNLDGSVERQLRAVTDITTARKLADVEVLSLPTGEKVRLGDIGTVEEGFEDGAIQGFSNTKRAIELDIQSTPNADTLTTNAILQDYLVELRPRLPVALEVQVYEVRAAALNDRIMLLVENAASGLLLVLVILFLFLNARIAFWVAAGIPVAILMTIGIMYLLGETINMMSLFALIMMLGIIVDDAIVVGEHTDTRLSMGDDAFTAAENGVGQMLTPVLAALTTTLATFTPLLLLSGSMGQIVAVLPLVVLAVGIASTIECFFILPSHLAHSLDGRQSARWSHWRVFFIALIVVLFAAAFFTRAGGEGGAAASIPLFGAIDAWRQSVSPFAFGAMIAAVAVTFAIGIEAVLAVMRRRKPAPTQSGNTSLHDDDGWFRRGFDAGFEWFRDKPFAALARLSFDWRYVSLSIAGGLVMIVVVGLTRGDHVGFVFFPSPEAENITGSLIFHPGTPERDAIGAIAEFETALRAAETQLGGGDQKLIEAVFVTLGSSGRSQGDNLASIKVQLTTSEYRTVRTPDIVRTWQELAPDLPSVRRFAIRQARGGPPGADVDVELTGSSIGVLKDAAVEVTDIVAAITGVTGVEDDLPYGKPELVMTLTPRGTALGFTLDEVGRQVRNAVEGSIPYRFARGDDEVAVRVSMDTGALGTAALRNLALKSPAGNRVPLTEVVDLAEAQGFSAIQRQDGKTTISVTGEVDIAVNTTDGVVELLTASGALDTVARKYGIEYSFGGRSQEQEETFADLRLGTIIGLAVIYIILAWVFGSYFRPFAVMLIIPFGAVGAVFGHWLMDYQLTMLSMIGLLGLSGIVVNDSIILVSRFDERLADGDSVREAAVGASRDRLRAVLLTSLTTIGGLAPLLFETNLQAQFLLPMAITMVFGLAATTLLVLFLVPVFLGIGNDIHNSFVAIYGRERGAVYPAPGE